MVPSPPRPSRTDPPLPSRRRFVPDRADRGLAALRVFGPDADPALDTALGNAQRDKRVDDPAFERMDIGAHVAPAPCQVELDIADALAGAMIGIAPADRKSTRLNSRQ